ncbi:hypothetical protein [Nonomuraea dietziae]
MSTRTYVSRLRRVLTAVGAGGLAPRRRSGRRAAATSWLWTPGRST